MGHDDLASSNTTLLQEVEDNLQHLCLNAMNSISISCTSQFGGSIQEHSVYILFDGGSDDNFIRLRLARFRNLNIGPVSSSKVLVGNGYSLWVEGLLQHLQVNIQGHLLDFKTILLPIYRGEIILTA